jgi:hypothetical protein
VGHARSGLSEPASRIAAQRDRRALIVQPFYHLSVTFGALHQNLRKESLPFGRFALNSRSGGPI